MRPRIVDRAFERADQAAARAAQRLTAYFDEARPSVTLLRQAQDDLAEAVTAWQELGKKKRS